MADLINLRSVRKNKSRKDREVKAEQNRHLHGQPLQTKRRLKAEKVRDLKIIDAHRIETPRTSDD